MHTHETVQRARRSPWRRRVSRHITRLRPVRGIKLECSTNEKKSHCSLMVRPLRHRQGPGLRHRLPPAAEGIQQQRLPSARAVLHGSGRGSGILLHTPPDRLARLQRLQGRDQAHQGVLRLHRPAQGQGLHGHRTRGGRHGTRRARGPHRPFSGDGDFRSLVEAVQRKGRKVSVVSTLQTQPAMVADELRRQATTSSISRRSPRGSAATRPSAPPARRNAPSRCRPPTRPDGLRNQPGPSRAPDPDLRAGGDLFQGSPFSTVRAAVDRRFRAVTLAPCRSGFPRTAARLPRCPRLVAFREAARAAEPTWHNAPW